MSPLAGRRPSSPRACLVACLCGGLGRENEEGAPASPTVAQVYLAVAQVYLAAASRTPRVERMRGLWTRAVLQRPWRRVEASQRLSVADSLDTGSLPEYSCCLPCLHVSQEGGVERAAADAEEPARRAAHCN